MTYAVPIAASGITRHAGALPLEQNGEWQLCSIATWPLSRCVLLRIVSASVS